jgi:hypothetical protein
MPINIAARRGAKNQRRKADVARKRKAELQAASPAGLLRQAVSEPIQYCLVSKSLNGVGLGSLIVARGPTKYDLTVAIFLLDAIGYGVKDVFLRSLGGTAFEAYLGRLTIFSSMREIDPGDARGLVHHLVARARASGLAPHQDYARFEPIFGDIQPTSGEIEFHSHDGDEALTIAGPAGMERDPITHDRAAAE